LFVFLLYLIFGLPAQSLDGSIVNLVVFSFSDNDDFDYLNAMGGLAKYDSQPKLFVLQSSAIPQYAMQRLSGNHSVSLDFGQGFQNLLFWLPSKLA
jgi:hypothetical protein